MRTIAIIGNGISGVTAARNIRKKSSDRIIIISEETPHFFSRTALMYIYMGHMKYEHTKPYEDHFWRKNNLELIHDRVNEVDFQQKELHLRDSANIKYDVLILGTGSSPNKFGWPGQDLPGVQGLYSFQDLENLQKNTHGPLVKASERTVEKAVIVGGGLIGVELAEMLLTRNIQVTFLVREDRFWGNVLPKEEGELVAKHMVDHHIDLRLNTELDFIEADANGRACAVITKKGERIDCQVIGLTAGVSPNISFLKNTDLDTDRGILVNEFLETNIPDVYAIGDCAQFHVAPEGRRSIEQVWYTGRMMGETVASTITGNRRAYTPGHWFNSAKFFDIEYQTYGVVPAKLEAGMQDFYWEDESGTKCVKLVFDTSSRKFIGINTFGIRMRHERFNQWLNEERTVDHVLTYLRDANFDAEFYKRQEASIIQKFNAEFNTHLSPVKKSWKRIFSKKAQQ